MVYLPITLFIACCALALTNLLRHPDPHHKFFYSLLPMLDLERSAGSRVDWDEILPPIRREDKDKKRAFGPRFPRFRELTH